MNLLATHHWFDGEHESERRMIFQNPNTPSGNPSQSPQSAPQPKTPLQIDAENLKMNLEMLLADNIAKAEEIHNIGEHIDAALKRINPNKGLNLGDYKNPQRLLIIARNNGLLKTDEALRYLDRILKGLEDPFLSNTKEEMHELIQKAKHQGESFRNQNRRNKSQAGLGSFHEYWRLRALFEQKWGQNYSMYLRERSGRTPDFSNVQNAQPVPGTNLRKGTLPDGRSITFNPRTGSSVISEGRSVSSSEDPDAFAQSSVSTDDLREAKRTLDQGPMSGGPRQLPRDRIASDGSVNYFTEGDRQDVEDFRNRMSRRKLDRLEEMERFDARRADIMDILTNRERFEEEFQKIKDKPIDFSDPETISYARRTNAIHSMLTNGRSIPFPEVNTQPSPQEIEALRNDRLARDSWEKVRRKSENMMSYDQLVTFEQMGWKNEETSKFIPSVSKEGFVAGNAYIQKRNGTEEIVLDAKGKILEHNWKRTLPNGSLLAVQSRFQKPAAAPLRSVTLDFEKAWKNGLPGKFAMEGGILKSPFIVNLETFPRDGRGLMIGDIAWVERTGPSAFRISMYQEGNFNLYAMEKSGKRGRHMVSTLKKDSGKNIV